MSKKSVWNPTIGKLLWIDRRFSGVGVKVSTSRRDYVFVKKIEQNMFSQYESSHVVYSGAIHFCENWSNIIYRSESFENGSILFVAQKNLPLDYQLVTANTWPTRRKTWILTATSYVYKVTDVTRIYKYWLFSRCGLLVFRTDFWVHFIKWCYQYTTHL